MPTVQTLPGAERLREIRPPDQSKAEKNRGRYEERRLWVVPAGELQPYLEETFGWRHIEQVAWLYRRRVDGDRTSDEWTTYLVTAPPARAPVRRIFQATRGHWGIENGVHRRRDVTLHEDQNRARIVAQALAWGRNLALSLARLHHFPYLSDAHAYASAHLAETPTWLTCSLAPLH